MVSVLHKGMRAVLVAVAAMVVVAGVFVWCGLDASMNNGREPVAFFVYPHDTPQSVKGRLRAGGMWDVLEMAGYGVRTGRYVIEPGESLLSVFRRLRSGAQTPVSLVVPEVRTLGRMAGRLADQLLLDSAELAGCFADAEFCGRYGYTVESLPSLFIPNSYEVYWTIGVDDLMKRLQRENDRFWNASRVAKAEKWGLSKLEVSTLASIVESETAVGAEKPMVAGLYYNRLRKGMLLQADPTVIFAVGDFSIRRVLNKHLAVDSPYNTYRYAGLPPGPIRVPSAEGLDAVLDHVAHPYVYMCAKEDFSGTHNFAVSMAEHMQNARRYQQALNARGIRR